MVAMVGYVVRETDAAVAFVAESDGLGRSIKTAQDGERIGIPMALLVDDAFVAKVKGI